MPKKAKEAGEHLENLAHHLRQGWAKLHPVSEQDLHKVKEALRQQEETERPEKKTEKGRTRKKSKDKGFDHYY